MGYDTEFSGSITITPALTDEQVAYLNLFHETRRMKRDNELLKEIYQGKHGLLGTDDYGPQGSYFAYDDGNMWQNNCRSILNTNWAPDGLWLWCPWYIDEEWELVCETGRSYDYQEWLRFMIEHFFKPWGRYLNGKVRWRGEEFDDMGSMIVKDNHLTIEG